MTSNLEMKEKEIEKIEKKIENEPEEKSWSGILIFIII